MECVVKLRLAMMDLESWQDQASFVDTLCLPVYGLELVDKQLNLARGKEIERVAYLIEKKLTGRLLLLPAISYAYDQAEFYTYLEQVISTFKKSGFHYLLLLSDRKWIWKNDPMLSFFAVQTDGKPLSDEELEAEAEKCYQQVVDLWVKNT